MCTQVLDSAIPRDVSRGLHALAQGVASQPALQGRVHGRLVDLIDCPPQLDLAVEVTAGVTIHNEAVHTCLTIRGSKVVSVLHAICFHLLCRGAHCLNRSAPQASCLQGRQAPLCDLGWRSDMWQGAPTSNIYTSTAAFLKAYAAVCAGNQLFHVVVDSADVALRCTELLQRAKAGRLACNHVIP
eukprot:scaffold95956_cov20-Tisochrysis_lutea.AAC.2